MLKILFDLLIELASFSFHFPKRRNTYELFKFTMVCKENFEWLIFRLIGDALKKFTSIIIIDSDLFSIEIFRK